LPSTDEHRNRAARIKSGIEVLGKQRYCALVAILRSFIFLVRTPEHGDVISAWKTYESPFRTEPFRPAAAALVTSLQVGTPPAAPPVPHGPPATQDPPIRPGAAGVVPTNSSKGVILPICLSAGRPLHSLCAGWLARRLQIARSEGPSRFAALPSDRAAGAVPTNSFSHYRPTASLRTTLAEPLSRGPGRLTGR